MPRPQRKAAARLRSLQEVLQAWEGDGGRRRECESRALGSGVCTGAQQRRGETGVKGLASGPARPATSPEGSARAAGETRRWRRSALGGGERRTRSGKGREARALPAARMRAALRQTAGPSGSAPTVRTLAEEEAPRPPRDARPPEACRGPLEGAGGHLFLQLGVREPRRGTRSLPSPHDERGGRSGACYRESVPGFPAHFNSVSASTARRFTPAGAPEPSAGTRCATPSHSPPPPERKVSSHPSSPSSVPGPASTAYFLRVPTGAGPGSS